MGKQGRQRRRQKQAKSRGSGGGHRGAAPRNDPMWSGKPSWAEGFALLAEAVATDAHRVADELVVALAPSWAAGVADAAATALGQAVSAAWERGWQPADLVHAVGRKCAGPDRRLLIAVVCADGANQRAHPAADPAWLGQLDDLEADLPRAVGVPGPGPADVVRAWAGGEGIDAVDALLRGAAILAQLWRVPGLPPIGDPPSAWGVRPRRRDAGGSHAPDGIDGRILGRVRALLAKAESTEFPPEAEALTAKAQELMARHSIDQAVVAASGAEGGKEQPHSRRVLIHDPYAKGKSYLLTEVAAANRCETVWSKELGFSTVFGYATDLAVTDILYTSLVTQCSTAMVAASRTVASPRAFRESFVLSFAIHIGARLAEATGSTVAEAAAEVGDGLLPILAGRVERVEAARDEAFPNLRSSRVRVSDSRGWSAGQAAARLARLEVGRAVER